MCIHTLRRRIIQTTLSNSVECRSQNSGNKSEYISQVSALYKITVKLKLNSISIVISQLEAKLTVMYHYQYINKYYTLTF